MPVWCEFHGRKLVVEARGEHDLDEMQRAIARALEDPAFQAPMEMVIAAHTSRANPAAHEIRRIIDYFLQIREHFEPEWTVMVGDALRYGLARMGAAFADAQGLSITVVRGPPDPDGGE